MTYELALSYSFMKLGRVSIVDDHMRLPHYVQIKPQGDYVSPNDQKLI